MDDAHLLDALLFVQLVLVLFVFAFLFVLQVFFVGAVAHWRLPRRFWPVSDSAPTISVAGMARWKTFSTHEPMRRSSTWRKSSWLSRSARSTGSTCGPSSDNNRRDPF